MKLPRRCPPPPPEAWEDGTRRSPDNAFNWNNGSATVFNTAAIKFHAKEVLARAARNVAEQDGSTLRHKNYASI